MIRPGSKLEVLETPDAKTSNLGPFTGHWSITEMALWDTGVVHEFEPAQLALQPESLGEMRFIAVQRAST